MTTSHLESPVDVRVEADVDWSGDDGLKYEANIEADGAFFSYRPSRWLALSAMRAVSRWSGCVTRSTRQGAMSGRLMSDVAPAGDGRARDEHQSRSRRTIWAAGSSFVKWSAKARGARDVPHAGDGWAERRNFL